jgi:hypothetical protein|tara:strand:- start:6458 stop:6865 length:408 start_codon:yes stop_codon:yes gene_type:complete
MFTKKLLFCLFVLASLSLTSCKKVEGEGGSSTITGKVTALDYNASGVYQNNTYDAADHDVFIIYGDGNTAYNDKVSTSYDGTFEFRYLEKGNYTIFVYEKCFGGSCVTNTTAILKKVTISKNKESVNAGTIEVKD